MYLSETFSRIKLGLASASLALFLISGNATAELENHSLFLIAFDPDRAADQAFALDLNLDIFANDLADVASVGFSLTSGEFDNWLGDPVPGSNISWGVYGIGIPSALAPPASQFVVYSTVDSMPTLLSQSDIENAIGQGRTYIQQFNAGNALEDFRVAAAAEAGHPGDWADTLGGNTGGSFFSRAKLGEAVEMYRFGIEPVNFEGVEPELLAGLWTLDAGTGTVEFSAVPIPAAVWMFGSALVGLFGTRRRAMA